MALDIFVPFWGDPALLAATVASVLEQDCDDWRLTVVDDAYPGDAARRHLESIDDERVRYVRHGQNIGITANYDACRAMATEELLVFLGCDDLLHPNFVRVVLDAAAAEPRAAIIQPGVQVVDELGREIYPIADRIKRRLAPDERRLLEGEELAASLLRGNWLYWPSLVFRRDRVVDVPFRLGLPIIQDLALVIDMTYRGDALLYEPTTCFSYRRHTASASAATVLDGTRFAGDRTYFAQARVQARERGWRRAERAARLRLTSRAHALSLVPYAAKRRPSALGQLLGHAIRP